MLAFLLAAVLLTACPLPVNGQSRAKGEFSLELKAPSTAAPGDAIDVVITIKNIQQELLSLEFFLDFDETKVAGVITEFGKAMDAFMTVTPMYTMAVAGMELPVSRYEQICTFNQKDGIYECRFMDLLQYPGAKPGEKYKGLINDGDLVITIPFKVLDGVKHADVLEFKVLDGSAKATTKSFQSVDGTAGSAKTSIFALHGATVSGRISTASLKGDTKVELWRKRAEAASYTATASGDRYTVENVTEGYYTLRASNQGYVTREYVISVGASNVTQDITLRLSGDVTGDGQVNTKDVNSVYSHVRSTNRLTDDYTLDCANVTGKELNIVDVAAIYAHTKGTQRLF